MGKIYFKEIDLQEFVDYTATLILERINNQGDSKSEQYLTSKEASKLLQISYPTLCKYAKNGVIPSYLIGRAKRYKQSELKEIVNKGVRLLNKQLGKAKLKDNPIPLPLKLKKNGFEYTQLLRNSKAYIYIQRITEDTICYEVFKCKIKPGKITHGKLIPAKIMFPNNEAFGYWAWSYHNLSCALNKFLKISGYDIIERTSKIKLSEF